VHREVALVRVRLEQDEEPALRERFAECKIVERTARGTLVQFTGTEGEISSLLEHLEPNGITEFVRSGRIAVTLAGDYDNDLTRSLHDLRPGASEGPEW
jgi:acetolactate synthase-1/3 small subunit